MVSKESRVIKIKMNKKEQIRRLKKYVKSRGIEPDLIDFDAFVDGSLTYKENKQKINEILKLLKNQKYSFDKIDRIYAFVDEYTTKRKKRSISMDLRKQAKKTFLLGELAYNKKLLKKYLKHPNRYDVENVDTQQLFSIKKIEEEIQKRMVDDYYYDIW